MSKNQSYQPVPDYVPEASDAAPPPHHHHAHQTAVYFAQPAQQTLIAQWVPPQPIPGLDMRPPRVDPSPGQVVIAYEASEPDVGLFRCSDLHLVGIASVVILFLVFWPLAWLPCCMSECHHRCQRPVYGYPPNPQSAPPHLVMQLPSGIPVYY